MSVNWSWKSKVGYIEYKSEKNNTKWRLNMYTGNMMCCFIYEEKETYTFFTWFNDMKHAKSCLKDMKLEDFPLGKHKVIKVVLYVNRDNKYSNMEMLKLGQLLAKMGYKVILK